MKENYGAGEIVEVTRRMPGLVAAQGWVAGRGWDPLCGILRFVERPLTEWIGQHPDSYLPTIIIICDGYFTDETRSRLQRRSRS